MYRMTVLVMLSTSCFSPVQVTISETHMYDVVWRAVVCVCVTYDSCAFACWLLCSVDKHDKITCCVCVATCVVQVDHKQSLLGLQLHTCML